MDWLSPVYAWGGATAAVLAGAGAVAYFFPPFRKHAIAAGLLVASVFTIYRKGAKDAAERAARQRAEEEREAVDRGNQARRDAERDVKSGSVRDPWDRSI